MEGLSFGFSPISPELSQATGLKYLRITIFHPVSLLIRSFNIISTIIFDVPYGFVCLLYVFAVSFIGTGNWYSVLQIVNRFNEITDNKVPYEFKPRRKGDISYCFADCSKAEDILGWKAKKTLDDIINDCVTRANYLKLSSK